MPPNAVLQILPGADLEKDRPALGSYQKYPCRSFFYFCQFGDG